MVRDGINGRLLAREDAGAFRTALGWIVDRPEEEARAMSAAARLTAGDFALERVADRALAAYDEIIIAAASRPRSPLENFAGTMRDLVAGP
jgi:glycosyltransferase involved in cell wall biosynthesis